MRITHLTAVAAAASLALVACADDDPTIDEAADVTVEQDEADPVDDEPDPVDDDEGDEGDEGDDQAAPQGPPPPAEGSVEVTAANYDYAIPDLTSGDTLAMMNVADDEVHELVKIRINEDDTRTDAEIIDAFPAAFEELRTTGTSEDPIATSVGGVLVAPPNARAFLADGDNELSAGRYLFVCALPINGDPGMLLAPPEEGAPPAHFGVDGPRHYDEGMITVVTVAGE